jgi:multiple sugar transport system permease protein
MSSTATTNQGAHKSPNPFSWLTENTLHGMARRKALLGYLFLAPTILGILIFTAGPVLFSFVLSLFRWNVFSPPEWIGVVNYTRMFADSRALTGFWNSFVFVLFAVALQVALGLLLAMILQTRMPMWLRYTYRTSFLLPMLMSGAATAIVLGYMLHKEFGAVNYYRCRRRPGTHALLAHYAAARQPNVALCRSHGRDRRLAGL